MVLSKRLTTFGGLIKRPSGQDGEPAADADTPEANVIRGIKLFCDSGSSNSGEEVLHLPTIVDAAVASPKAAEAACHHIRKLLSKDNYSRPAAQYNAVMLIRILADNPGPTFTKHMDKQFADTVKHLLRNGQDPSVAQILRETLDSLDREKASDINLTPLFAMWKKEKGLMASAQKQFGPRVLHAPGWNGQNQHGDFQSHRPSRTLPPPSELSGRIEEARTSAKLLLQLVQSTPSNELLANDLVKEFSERCMVAQRSIQGYINCDNPPPDDDTMLTLIETNEQLSLAASKHQRAILQARKAAGLSSPSPPAQAGSSNSYAIPGPSSSGSTPPPQLPPRHEAQILSMDFGNPSATPAQVSHAIDTSYKTNLPPPPALQPGASTQGTSTSTNAETDNPFADHHSPNYGGASNTNGHLNGQGQAAQSDHPGFQSTPSYLNRQESSANNLTMHGAASPVSASGNPNRTDMLEHAPGNQQAADVSQVPARGPVTYRY